MGRKHLLDTKEHFHFQGSNNSLDRLALPQANLLSRGIVVGHTHAESSGYMGTAVLFDRD
jgi:hypothetical protein